MFFKNLQSVACPDMPCPQADSAPLVSEVQVLHDVYSMFITLGAAATDTHTTHCL